MHTYMKKHFTPEAIVSRPTFSAVAEVVMPLLFTRGCVAIDCVIGVTLLIGCGGDGTTSNDT